MEPVSTTSFQSNFENEQQKKENGSVSFPSNGNVGSEGTSWAFNEPSLETGNEKEVMSLTIRIVIDLECGILFFPAKIGGFNK